MGLTLDRFKLALFGAAAITATAWLVPGPATAAPNAWNCNDGSFCVYSGDNGTGSVCAWSGDDPDWHNGTSQCSWTGSTRVQSAFNNGLSGLPVSAYTAINSGGTKVFCLAKGGKTNLAGVGTYLRSHTWSC
ncbi:peptidase inhibitor family I36 protein [Streptomyces sp. NRRL S-237]|uniref:peptidase inhibitor family I36 protein n=1 Tax=Streptomyces sp. NRRL S-237 TaxID=1463895 RepID=UPI0004C937DE|nr:peptidase inhibitor family I36 protein [Streptomyces sp. NRRL S-237]